MAEPIKRKETIKQVSDTIGLGLLLALSGGLMDAYSYLYRGEVFANAQTGNMLLFGVNLAQGKGNEALYYFFPVVAFALGILSAQGLRHAVRTRHGFHWRQAGVLAELLLLAVVAFMPRQIDLLANSLISLACGFQVEAFRKIQGNSIATTMCIGNLRSALHAVSEYHYTGRGEERRKAGTYFLVIASFVVGAILGNAAIVQWQGKAILCSSVILLICFVLMCLDPEAGRKRERGEDGAA